MKICISTWGNPEAWRYAGYVSDEGAAARGFSTLNLLVEGMGCDKIYIIVLNTLVSLQGLNSYDDVERRVAEYVENYLCLKPEHRNRVEMVVAPGTMKKQVGNFNEHFSTDLRNTRLKILTELYLRVINVVSGLQRQKVEVLLDVTHGINYLPVIASEAVEELAASISASLGEPVELEIYNADPFPGIEDQRLRDRLARSKHNLCHPVEDLGDHEIPMLTYSRLTRISIRPWHITGFMSYEESVGKLVSDVRECELSGNEVRSLVEVVRRISAAYRVGAVVELIKLIEGNRDIDDRIYKTLLQVVRCWQRNARIEVRERFIELTTKKLLDGIRLLIHAHSIVTGAKSTLEELEPVPKLG
ncbi:MAG: TM1812 family CRISPR-associated protein [Ignisphaera sp.]|nr:TM1812 family CRISPR-associated protein [Ignisphaera sp.]